MSSGKSGEVPKMGKIWKTNDMTNASRDVLNKNVIYFSSSTTSFTIFPMPSISHSIVSPATAVATQQRCLRLASLGGPVNITSPGRSEMKCVMNSIICGIENGMSFVLSICAGTSFTRSVVTRFSGSVMMLLCTTVGPSGQNVSLELTISFCSHQFKLGSVYLLTSTCRPMV